MSGNYPITPGFKAVGLKSRQPTTVTISESGRSQAIITGGHLWEFTAEYSLRTRAAMMPVYAFVVKQQGSYGVFQIKYPLQNQGVGLSSETAAKVNSSIGIPAGSASIPINGLVPGVTDKFIAGDLIKFSGNKVHMVTDNANTNTNDGLLIEGTTDRLLIEGFTDALLLEDSNQAMVNIMPLTIEDLSNDESVTVDNISFTMRIKPPGVTELKTTAPQLSKFQVDLIEAI